MGKKTKPKNQEELERYYEKIKKRNKMSKEDSKETIEMLGGKQVLQDYADGLEQYATIISSILILEGLSPDETTDKMFLFRKMIKDMRNGKTWMFSHEGVSNLYENKLATEKY